MICLRKKEAGTVPSTTTFTSVFEAPSAQGALLAARLARGQAGFVEGEVAQPGDVPAFFLQIRKGVVRPKLPDPGQAFGIYLNEGELTETALKELAALMPLSPLETAVQLVRLPLVVKMPSPVLPMARQLETEE